MEIGTGRNWHSWNIESSGSNSLQDVLIQISKTFPVCARGIGTPASNKPSPYGKRILSTTNSQWFLYTYYARWRVRKIYQLSELIKYGNRILTIGRERDNLLHITEQQSAYISRHHCTIETNPATDKWIIRDGQWQKELKLWQESSNGTYVNSTQVTKQGHILKIGDIISIGDVKMRFENY